MTSEPMNSLDERTAELEAMLLRFFRERGDLIAGDGTVGEAAAAASLGYASASALAKMVDEGRALLPYRVLNRRRWYAVRDLARVLAAGWHTRQ
jgi:hypothetical protein